MMDYMPRPVCNLCNTFRQKWFEPSQINMHKYHGHQRLVKVLWWFTEFDVFKTLLVLHRLCISGRLPTGRHSKIEYRN